MDIARNTHNTLGYTILGLALSKRHKTRYMRSHKCGSCRLNSGKSAQILCTGFQSNIKQGKMTLTDVAVAGWRGSLASSCEGTVACRAIDEPICQRVSAVETNVTGWARSTTEILLPRTTDDWNKQGSNNSVTVTMVLDSFTFGRISLPDL